MLWRLEPLMRTQPTIGHSTCQSEGAGPRAGGRRKRAMRGGNMEETARGERRRGRGLGEPGSGVSAWGRPTRLAGDVPTGMTGPSGGSALGSAEFRGAEAESVPRCSARLPVRGAPGRAGLPWAAGIGYRELTLSLARAPGLALAADNAEYPGPALPLSPGGVPEPLAAGPHLTPPRAPSHPLPVWGPWPLPSAEARMSSAMVCPGSMPPVPLCCRASPGSVPGGVGCCAWSAPLPSVPPRAGSAVPSAPCSGS